jgi:hypothetical protein
MVRHLRSLHHGRELADAIPPARPMRGSGRMRGHASRATQKTDLSESAEIAEDRRPPDAGLTLERRMRKADVGSQCTDTIKLTFRTRCGAVHRILLALQTSDSVAIAGFRVDGRIPGPTSSAASPSRRSCSKLALP